MDLDKEEARPGKCLPSISSRKTPLEDAKAAPHSPRSVPTNFDVNSEPELIEGNILRAEPLPSGSHRNISVPIQKLVQISKRRGVGNIPKPLAGGHELLLTHQELSGSAEGHRTLRRLEPIVLQRQGQKDKELLKEPTSFICISEEGNGMTPALEEDPVASTSFKPAPEASKEKPKGPQKKKKGLKNHQGKGKGKANLNRPYPQEYRIPKLEPSSVDSVFNMARTIMEFTAKKAGKDEQDFSTQIIYEIQFVKSSIDVELGKFDPKLNKITSDISELKRNDKNHTEWYKLTNVRLDSITNKCDRIESKFQVQND
ncbi:hypothetical protein O181_123825 [Austropuccinia psidii MF-1]|uniref:Uncharacterized protein n=1 Tax=Austropuccinia psidii MF-1 TaxID=1389203 RepID=A0A9Q3KRX1_9BASI|nr:hypothetical protein [Austropuccinia psidii MF-1]